MDILVLDKNFISIALVDQFESLIWTDRYQGAGDFELYLPMEMRFVEIFKKDYYLWMKESEHVMIIEKIQIDSDVDMGVHLTVTGKSLENLLTRRIVWNQTRFRSKIDTAINRMLEDAFINPEIPKRQIANFVYKKSDDPVIDEITIDKQHSGTEVYEAVVELCKLNGLGFKLVLTNDNMFEFQLYAGKDRSYDQFQNPYVIFSPHFDNLISSDYLETNGNEKNVTLVAGEDENLGTGRRSVVIGDASGIDRRELYVDARDIQSEIYDEDGNEDRLSDKEYEALLIARGEEKMLDYKPEVVFTGEAETQRSFQYGKDFFMGDIVQVEDGYGHANRARVIEFIFSQNESGIQTYPTFEVVEEEVS